MNILVEEVPPPFSLPEHTEREEAFGEETWHSIRCMKALASPVRLKILELLLKTDGTLCVSQLVEAFAPLAQPTLSHHLRILYDAGIIRPRKVGLCCYYHVRLAALKDLHQVTAHLLDQTKMLEGSLPLPGPEKPQSSK